MNDPLPNKPYDMSWKGIEDRHQSFLQQIHSLNAELVSLPTSKPYAIPTQVVPRSWLRLSLAVNALLTAAFLWLWLSSS